MNPPTAAARHLADHSVLAFSGDDAAPWLQGQVTQDLRDMTAGDVRYALFTSVRGKILSDAWIAAPAAGVIRAIVPTEAIPALRESFDRYIIMEDVVVTPEPSAVITVRGTGALKRLRDICAELEPWPTTRDGLEGADALVAPDMVPGVLMRLEQAGVPAEDNDWWERERIVRRAPRFGIDFGNKNYPQEAGLLSAVSFQKGCYLGQEVVCTLESRGQVSKRLVALEGTGSAVPPRGAVLRDAEGTDVGHITSSTRTDDGVRALGYVRRADAQPGASVSAPTGTLRVSAVVGQGATT